MGCFFEGGYCRYCAKIGVRIHRCRSVAFAVVKVAKVEQKNQFAKAPSFVAKQTILVYVTVFVCAPEETDDIGAELAADSEVRVESDEDR